jgi:outer membrane murein-binding lipoprotein Lpp
MNSTTSKLFVAAAFLAAVLTSGCASFGTEGASDEATAGDGILHSQYDDAVTQQMKESSRAGGE